MNYWPQKSIAFSDSPVTVTVDDRAFWCNATLGNIVLNLPSVTGKAALYFVFKKIDTGTNTVTINAPAGKTIDGASFYTLTQFNQIIGVVADTTGNFFLVDGNSSGSIVGTGKSYIEKTNGDFVLGALAGVPNTLLTVNLPITGDVVITVSGSTRFSGQPTSFTLGVRVDSTTDYVWDANESLVGAGSDYFHSASLSHRFVIPLMTQGSHTFQIIASGTNMTLQAHSGEPVSMIVEYSSFITFGGGSPTSDPTNDLAGTWNSPTVVGIQNDKLPSKIANGYLRRDPNNTSWLYDPTLLMVGKDPTFYGPRNKLNFIDLTNIITTVLDDITNSRINISIQSTASGGGGGGGITDQDKFDILYDRKFWVDNNILPSNKKFELLDFTGQYAVQSGTWVVEDGQVRGTSGGLIYFDMGASFSKVLMIICGRQPGVTNFTMGMTNIVPVSTTPDGYTTADDNSSTLYKVSGGGYTAIGTIPIFQSGVSAGWALYLTTNVQRAYRREGMAKWYRHATGTDGTFTSFRYVYFQNFSGAIRWEAPFVVYAQ